MKKLKKRRITILKNSRIIVVVVSLVAMGLGWNIFATAAISQDLQRTPIVLLASEVLPKSLLTGPNYRIKDMVINDGMINTYELDTNYGPLKVESTALLLKRINEIRAISKIEQLKGTDVYVKALTQAGMAPIRTAEGLVLDPVGTVTGVASGIGRFFHNASSSLTGSSPYKDNIANSLLGQSSYKREFAHQFDVDPYTSYEPLQKALNDLSWTATAGGLTVKAALTAIPGAAVAVVSYTSTAGSFKALVNEKTPSQLAEINRNKLYSMGVPDPVVQVFMQNTYFNPWEQTLLVGELANMTGVKNTKVFIERAIGASEDSVAVFLRVRAQLIGLYQEKTKSVARFVDANGFPFMMTSNGVVVGIFPLDFIAWTAGFARNEGVVSSAIKQMQGVTGKELWITGTVDLVARKALEDRGWKVKDKFEDQVFMKMGH